MKFTRFTTLRIQCAVAAASLFPPLNTIASAQIYTAIRLTAPSGDVITPHAVIDGDKTEKVRVVGMYGNLHAAMWTTSSFLDLPPLTGGAAAITISKTGVMYGVDYAPTAAIQLIGWTSTGGASAPSPAPYTLIGAIAGNNLNAVVSNGYILAPDGVTQTNYGCYVLANGGIARLVPLSGDIGAEGYSINDNGVVVGRSGTGNATIWTSPGVPANLGNLGGNFNDNYAFGINNGNQVVGYSTLPLSVDPNGFRHAFLWQNGTMSALPDGGFLSSQANAINDAGQVVGWADRRAVLWSNGGIIDLNAYAPPADNVTFQKAIAISPNGAIIVTATVNGTGGEVANYVLIPLQTGAVALDLDRDGAIRFDDPSDKTSETNPFVFWTNEDVDVIVGKDEEDSDPSVSLPDYQHSTIACKRDLEDFSRIWIRAPIGFDASSGQWSVKCSMAVSSGDPGINVWAAVTDSTGYLSDSTIADQQISTVGFKPLLASSPVSIDPKLFTYRDPASAALYAPLLFEGRTPGKFALVVSFLRNGIQVAEDRAYLDIRRISAFYDHFTVGDTTTIDAAQIPSSATQIQTALIRGTTNDYLLFVHGWRMQPWERRAFAETAYKRLWHLGYKGDFGLYSWPTEYIDGRIATIWKDKDPLQNYDRSEHKAWKSAFGLRQLLHDLTNQSMKVHVLAHSMGNIAMSEALEIEGESTTPQQIVSDYAATQAATVAQAYDSNPLLQVLRKPTTPNVYLSHPPTQTVYYAKVGLAVNFIYNLNNRKDYALGYWLTNQKLKPDIGWGFSTSAGFYRSDVSNSLSFPQDRAEIFSFVAQAWSNALGREPNVTMNITSSVDLNAEPFKFGGGSTEHSAEFNSTIMQRVVYWAKLGSLFNIALNPTLN